MLLSINLRRIGVFFLLFSIQTSVIEAAAGGIPGTTNTENGYDTELGTDAICWKSQGDTTTSTNMAFPNELIQDFKLAGEVELLTACPNNNTLQATAPIEWQLGERLRTHEFYDYTVNITLNLSSLGGTAFVADQGPLVAIQVIVCVLGQSGFCSPFIHEESNARLESLGITEETPPGERHGGSHVHSDYIFVKLDPSSGPYYEFSEQVPMVVYDAGSFFAIASVQMFISTSFNNTVRYDMANALVENQRLVQYDDPPTIMQVNQGVLITSYVAIGIASCIILFLLEETIRHRNHQVLQLTQGYFLIVFLLAGLAATIASFLFQPKNDTYCRVSSALILSCLQLFYAILVGRLWRINAVISPLLVQSLQAEENRVTKLFKWLGRITTCSSPKTIKSNSNRSRSIRKKVTSRQLATVVAIFTIPQVVLQILGATLQPLEVTIDFNDDKSKGRVICDCWTVEWYESFTIYGYICFVLLILALLIMAHATSKLPSLFNETKVIYGTTLTALIVVIVGVVLVVVTNNPTTTPAVQYLVWVAITLCITVNTSVKIMLPKLRLVWRNETVLVSKLVSDHTKSFSQESAVHPNVTGLYPPPTSNQRPTSSNTAEVMDELEDFSKRSNPHVRVNADQLAADGKEVKEAESTETGTPSDSLQGPESGPARQTGGMRRRSRLIGFLGMKETVAEMGPSSEERRADELSSRPPQSSHHIVVSRNEAPARRLVLKMVDLQEQLATVNKRIMSGLAVSEEDWMTVRRLACRLGTTFTDEVKFAWEERQEPSGELAITNEETKDDNGPRAEETTDLVDDGAPVEELEDDPTDKDEDIPEKAEERTSNGDTEDSLHFV